MNWLKNITAMIAMIGATATGQETGGYEPHPDWENPQNLFQGREDSRAFFVPFANRGEALKGHRGDSSLVLPLNGNWKFNWVPSPDQRPLDFFKPETDVSGWKDIDVPSNWQMRGYGTPIYSNQRYTCIRDWPRVMTAPRNGDEKRFTTPQSEPNAVGSYRKDIELPADWAGQEVFIRFDGVDSFFYLYVNGEKVGFSKDSRTAAVFDITKYVKPGKNVIAAEVYRYSDGTYLECQDMWRLSGIFRDVYLYTTPRTFIRDFFIHTDFAQEGSETDFTKSKLRVEMNVANRSGKRVAAFVDGELVDAAGKTVARLESGRVEAADGGEADFTMTADVANPALWSAEKPNLYTLLLTLKDGSGAVTQTISRKVGFRKVELTDGRFLVNGMPVKLKGVNRHESQHANGHAVTREECRQELELMKRGNINHIRNSHYPQPDFFYEMCDELGIYVCDEANIESHGYYYGEDSLSHPKEWRAQHVWRNRNMVEQSKNHPCVVIWSYGNEAGPGDNFAAVRDWIKSRDTSRVTQYERNNDLADLHSNQYPSVNWTREIASRKLQKPWYISEYAHILCNSMGNLKDYWEAIDSSDSIIGGGIWEWIHQSYDQEVTLADGTKVVRQSYGGDHGEYPHDGIFCIKGVIYSDRTTTPLYDEIRKVQQNVEFSLGGVNAVGNTLTVNIRNKNCFTNTDEFDAEWVLTKEGTETVARGTFTADIAPLQSGKVEIPVQDLQPEGFSPDSRYFLTVNLKLRENTAWAKKGYVVATEQLLLPEDLTKFSSSARLIGIDKDAKVDVRNENSRVLVIGKNFSVSVDKATGGLRDFIANGHQILGEKPTLMLNAFRAPLANDKWAMNQWLSNGFRNMTHTATPLFVERLQGGMVRISCDVTSQGIRKESLDSRDYDNGKFDVKDEGPIMERDFKFVTQLVYTIMPNGYISVQAGIVPSVENVVLPKLGYQLMLPERYNHVKWYGRGPGENYPDRKDGAAVGIWDRSVENMLERYPFPMEMGNRMDTKWVSVTDDAGVGLMVAASADEKLNFSALPCTAQAIFSAPHPEEVERARATVLNVDAVTLGLGGAACGPRPIDRDIPLSKPTTFVFSLRPVIPGQDVAVMGREVLPLTGAVTLSRDSMGYVHAACGSRDAKIHITLPDGSTKEYTGPFLQREEGNIIAMATSPGSLEAVRVVQHLPAWKPDNLMRIVSCSSSTGAAESPWNIIDGRRDTIWHSYWHEPVAQYPHNVVVDLGMTSELRGFAVTPRQGRASSRVRKIAFYLSNDGKDWGSAPACELEMEDSDNEQRVLLSDLRKARYVKMVCLEPMVKGEPYAAIAELVPIITHVEGEYPPHAFYAITYASSEMAEGGAARNVLDGNPDTVWHTTVGVTVASFPHELRLDLGGDRKLKGIRYTGGKGKKGRVKDYEVYVSNNGTDWGEPVARGSFSDNAEQQQALFFTPASAKFLRFVALSAHDGGDSAVVAELDAILEGEQE
ncbi:MAG: glycoside hydrolase family 2 TIM barrel-domain containing protein [Akkermansia sp.]|nr:glycoside hydrolase family 2 TIM barrel-domain containing protein [Akkermansia sp.]